MTPAQRQTKLERAESLLREAEATIRSLECLPVDPEVKRGIQELRAIAARMRRIHNALMGSCN